MAKRKSNKKAGKEVRKKTKAKGAAKSAAKKSIEHKLADDKDKATIEIPSDIEHPLEQTDRTQTDKPVDGPKEVDVIKSDAEILTEKEDDSQQDDQAGVVTEAIIEAAAETERLADEVGNSQTEEQTDDRATGAVIEGPDAVENLTENVGGAQTDKSVGDVSESVVEGDVTTENTIEKIDDFPADKQTEDSTGKDVESPNTEIHAGKVKSPQTDEQTGEITEEILEAAAETERLAEEAESLQIDDEQMDILVEVEDSDAVEGLIQEIEDTEDAEAGKSVDDMSEPVVEDSVTVETKTENVDDTRAEDQPEEINEALIKDPDSIESRIEDADDFQTDIKAGDATETVVETEKLAEEVESLQTEDEQAGIIVETEDPDAAESPSLDTEDTETDKSVDDTSEDSVTAETPTENIDDTRTEDQPEDENETSIEEPDTIESRIEKADDTQTNNQASEVVEVAADAEETDFGDTVAENQTVVDRIKKLFSGIFRVGSKTEDSTEESIESPETVANHIGETDYTRADNQAVSSAGDNVEVSDDEILTAVYSDRKPYRTKKTGIIISVFIVIAAVILLIVASIERRSAKKALVQISRVAESVKQMQEETLKGREQVTHSQIESRELVIDALSLTRNGLELERANSDEVEVKRIISVFINDIDERITKIKGVITLLKNKLKETD